MANGSYTYDSANIKEQGKDRMRFELGDVVVHGGEKTAALTDTEITVAIEMYPEDWKRAKLKLLESLFHRFAFQTDTKVGALTLEFENRAKMWKDEYESLKKEISRSSCPRIPKGNKKTQNDYFFEGMMQNRRNWV